MSTLSKTVALNDAGSTQYLSRADAAALRVVNGWTVEFWILLNTPNANAYIAYSRSGENGWGITLANPSGNNYVIRVEGGSGSYEGANGTVNIYDGKWHHVRVYYNGASTKLYIDGTLDSTLNVPTISNPNATVYIGSKAAGAGTYLVGGLAVFRIWNNEHTTADSTTIYGTATSNMQVEYSFDGALTDASGNGLTLSSNGSPTVAFLTSAPTDMQVSGRVYVGHHDDSNGVQSGTTTNTKTIHVAKAGSLIAVVISSATAGDNHGTPTIDGNNMTQVESAITGTNRRDTLWYYANNSVGSHTLSISPSSISNRYSWGFTVLENVATSSPVDVSGVGGAETGTSRTATLNITQANSAMLVMNYNLYDAGTNSTKVWGTGDDANLFVNADAKSTGNFSMTATSGSSQNAYVAVAFKVAQTIYNQTLDATTTVSGALLKQMSKTLAVTSSVSASVLKQLTQTFNVTATATASMFKQMAKTFDVTATINAALEATKVYLQDLDATLNVSATIAKVPGKLLDVTSTISATLTKTISTSKILEATATVTASVTKGLSKTLGATTTVAANLTKIPGKLLEASTAITAIIDKTQAKVLTATANVTATIVAGRAVIMNATTTVSAEVAKQVGKLLTVTATITAKILAPFWRTKYPAHGDGDDYEIKYPHD